MRLRDIARIRELLCESVNQAPLPDGLYEDIARTGALLRGHFALQGGDHSEYFVRFSQLGWEPTVLQRVARLLRERSPFDWKGSVLLCSEAAGFFLGHALALETEARLAVTKVDLRKRPMAAWRQGGLQPGDRVLVVNDVVTRGGALDFLLQQARDSGAKVEGVVTFATLRPADFSERLKQLQLRGGWLLEARWPLYTQENCALCARGDALLPAAEFA